MISMVRKVKNCGDCPFFNSHHDDGGYSWCGELADGETFDEKWMEGDPAPANCPLRRASRLVELEPYAKPDGIVKTSEVVEVGETVRASEVVRTGRGTTALRIRGSIYIQKEHDLKPREPLKLQEPDR